MYELKQAAGNSYYIDCPAKIGVVKQADGTAILIDSGSDKDAGRRVKKILEDQGLELKYIFNTHHHADHTGGNRYLQNNTGCRIFAPPIEASITRTPLLEPVSIFGAFPPKDLQNKFLMAKESTVEDLPVPGDPRGEGSVFAKDSESILPEGWEIIPLPGHSFQMVGFRTPDNVVYLADSLSSERTLEKYGICFLVDVGASLETLEMIKGLEAEYFVPSHAQATKDIRSLAQLNIQKILEIKACILEFCQKEICFEDLLREMFRRYGLTMDFSEHTLVGSTVRSYLAHLKDQGLLEIRFTDNKLLWHST